MKELATTLKVNKEIGRALDGLITAATERVKVLKNDVNNRGELRMKENQLRNVVNVACATPSVEAVTNFIRYQIGRSDKEQTWRHDNFGVSVIKDIESEAVPKALAAIAKEVPEADAHEAQAKVVALYLGYLNRAFVAASKAGFDVLDRYQYKPAKGGEGNV